MPINDQLDIACDALRADKKLSNGYNAFGLSQGALFMYVKTSLISTKCSY